MTQIDYSDQFISKIQFDYIKTRAKTFDEILGPGIQDSCCLKALVIYQRYFNLEEKYVVCPILGTEALEDTRNGKFGFGLESIFIPSFERDRPTIDFYNFTYFSILDHISTQSQVLHSEGKIVIRSKNTWYINV